MNFWHMQLHPDNSRWCREKELLEKFNLIGLGTWNEGASQQSDFEFKMKVGDIVAIKRGEILIALTKVVGDYEYTNTVGNLDWFQRRRKVEILDWYKSDLDLTVSPRGTLTKCNMRNIYAKTNASIVKWYKISMMNEPKNKIIDLLEYKHQIILQGPPGTGKTRQAKLVAQELIKPKIIRKPQGLIDELISQGEYEVIQFHPAYSYEDFVRGIVAETTDDGHIKYTVENKILAKFAQKAKHNPNGKYVLIIDEINRANLPSVLGELIYALEYRNEPVTSMYEFESDKRIILPKNLYIIGTMNTADRSVGHIDYAIRRRFAFFDILPDEDVIENIKAKKLFNDVAVLFSNDFLSPDFKRNDVMIGHSYFLTDSENILKTKLDYEIKPILREYLKDGILLDTASEKIEALNV